MTHITHVLADKLTSLSWMMATAESCTGGLIASQCTDLPGSSRWDDRFMIKADASMAGVPIQPWTKALSRQWPEETKPAWLKALPGMARAGLPVIGSAGAFWVPKPGSADNNGVSIHFQPTMPVSGGGFTVA